MLRRFCEWKRRRNGSDGPLASGPPLAAGPPDVDGRMSDGCGGGESELFWPVTGTIEVILNEFIQFALSMGRLRICGLVEGPLA